MDITLRLEISLSPDSAALFERLALALRAQFDLELKNSAGNVTPQDGGAAVAPLPRTLAHSVTVSSQTSPETQKSPAVFLPEETAPKLPKSWTVERDICLASMKALGHRWSEIWIAMNELNGQEIASSDACAARYYALQKAGRLPKVTLREVTLKEEPAAVAAKGLEAKPVQPPPVAATKAAATKVESQAATKPVAQAVKQAGTTGLREALQAELKQVKAPPAGVERMSLPEARAWAAQRGLCNGYDGAFNLAEVNQKRAHLGLRKIELVVGR